MSFQLSPSAPSASGFGASISSSNPPFIAGGAVGLISGATRAGAALQDGYYSSIGGGAAPFGPVLDMRSLENGALLRSCIRHIHRTTRKQRHRQRATSEDKGGNGGPDRLSFQFVNGGSFHQDGSTRTGKLYCRSGHHLQIHQDGKVNGTRQEDNRFGVLEFLSVAFGLVSIKGKESHRYLCMNRRGRLYGSTRHTGECIFMEKMLENYYNTYTSCRYGRGRHSKKKWYVALNKRGRPKRGNQSRKKHRFTQFLVLHLDDEDYKWTRRKFTFPNRDTYFGMSSFAQEWRRRQSPWEQVRFGQPPSTLSVAQGRLQAGSLQTGVRSSSSSIRNIPLINGAVNASRVRQRQKREATFDADRDERHHRF